MRPTTQEAIAILQSDDLTARGKSNADLVRQALYDLRTSLGQVDWEVTRSLEGVDIKMVRAPVIMTYHVDTKRWKAHVTGLQAYGSTAVEAYSRLREKLEFFSGLLKKM